MHTSMQVFLRIIVNYLYFLPSYFRPPEIIDTHKVKAMRLLFSRYQKNENRFQYMIKSCLTNNCISRAHPLTFEYTSIRLLTGTLNYTLVSVYSQ